MSAAVLSRSVDAHERANVWIRFPAPPHNCRESGDRFGGFPAHRRRAHQPVSHPNERPAHSFYARCVGGHLGNVSICAAQPPDDMSSWQFPKAADLIFPKATDLQFPLPKDLAGKTTDLQVHESASEIRDRDVCRCAVRVSTRQHSPKRLKTRCNKPRPSSRDKAKAEYESMAIPMGKARSDTTFVFPERRAKCGEDVVCRKKRGCPTTDWRRMGMASSDQLRRTPNQTVPMILKDARRTGVWRLFFWQVRRAQANVPVCFHRAEVPCGPAGVNPQRARGAPDRALDRAAA